MNIHLLEASFGLNLLLAKVSFKILAQENEAEKYSKNDF